MNSLLAIGGGGLLAYLLLRHRDAMAASQPAPGTTVPPQPLVAWPIPSTTPPVLISPGVLSPPILATGPKAPTQPLPGPVIAGPPMRITTPAPAHQGEVPALQLAGRWGWPVPRWQGRAPVISDGFGSPRPGMLHQGVDLMFARIASDPFPTKGPNGTRMFVMPDAWPAVAASDGVLWSAQRTPRGYAVVIDHGTVATFYQHLETLVVPETKPPPKGTPRQQRIQIRAGQPLGVIGGDPLDPAHLKHLHFELWPAGPQSAIDPQRLMRSWQVFGPADLAPFLTARNAAKRHADQTVKVESYFRRPPRTLSWGTS